MHKTEMELISHLIGANVSFFFLQRNFFFILFHSVQKQKLFSGNIIDIYKYQL